ncbi:hypothetical protein GCK32_012784 [Trichostrongylus colubriformis]|uniref:Uncharacterized protein n=1 Tax=Trichostrongylus colubriformis TaxID=6319 RepID=A0AAN8FMA6_TRICO
MMRNNNKFNAKLSDKDNNTNQLCNEAESFQEFQPAQPAVSQYLMDQIHLEKPSKSEIENALKQQEKSNTPSEERLRPPTACPSEYQMTALNNQLSIVPMVKAFNELERRKKQGS